MKIHVHDLIDKQTVDQRQSNIELLRIVAMFLIVASHFAIHGNFKFPSNTVTANELWIQFLQLGAKVGVNIYVFISGYFLVSNRTVKSGRIIRMWLQIFTYSLLLYVIAIILGIEIINFKSIIRAFLPITYINWWFATSYFVLYLLSPYINKMLRALSIQEYHVLLCICTVLWCFIPSITGKPMESNSLVWFVYIFFVSSYIRLHCNPSEIKGKSKTYLIGGCVVYFLTFISSLLFDLLGTHKSFFADHATFFFDMNKLPVFLISLFLFVGFLKLDLGHKHYVNKIASACFGVYLLHDSI